MTSASRPVLPVTAGQPMVAGVPPPSPEFRTFINRAAESARNGLVHRRPWLEFANRSAFSKPESLSEAASRIFKNYAYFRVNYLSVIVLIIGISLLAHPLSFVSLLCLLASWLYLYLFRPADQPLVILGRLFSDGETLGLLVVFSLVVIFFTSVGSVLISSLMVGMAVICAHGVFRSPDDHFLAEQDPAAAGFISFLGGSAFKSSASSSAAAPSMRTR